MIIYYTRFRVWPASGPGSPRDCSYPEASPAHICDIVCTSISISCVRVAAIYSRPFNSSVVNTLHQGELSRAARSYGHAYKAPRMSLRENPTPGIRLSSLSTIGRIYFFAHSRTDSLEKESFGQADQGVSHETGSEKLSVVKNVIFSASRPNKP